MTPETNNELLAAVIDSVTPEAVGDIVAISNEQRADLGADAVRMVATQTSDAMGTPIASVVRNALTDIAHVCERLGLPADALFADAVRRYHEQRSQSEPVKPASGLDPRTDWQVLFQTRSR